MRAWYYAAMFFTITTANAQADDTIVARELGQVVGTADACGYELDEDVTASKISERLSSTSELARVAYEAGLRAQKVRIKQMSELEKKVVCATQKKLAQKYGLLK